MSRRRDKFLGIALIIALLSGRALAYQEFDQHQSYSHNDGGSYRGSGLITRCEAPGTGGFFISKDKYPYAGAAAACTALGGSLADISNQNFLLASDLVLTCAGPNQRAWIGSWDYNENGIPVKNSQDCLSVFVRNVGPGGGIENVCPGDRPVLCQLHQSTVPHNSLYSQSVPSYAYQTAVASNVPVHEARPRGDYVPYPGGPALYPPAVNHPKPPYHGGYPPPYQGGGGFQGPHREYPQGPNGGYPGGVYPGGPGYGNGGYPYGYPNNGYPYNGYGGKKGHKEGKGDRTVTVLSTTTINGLVTTLTLSGIETIVTVENAASTVTLDAIVSTIVLQGVPSTVTEIIDGIPVTVTVEGIPSTSTVTMVGTSTITDLEVTTLTETDVELLTAIEYVTVTSTFVDVQLTTDTQSTTATVTDTITDVELFTATVNNTLVINNTLTEIQLLTVTDISVFTSTQLVTLPPSIVTLPPETVTVTPNPVILPANTITLPADIVTITQAPLPAITVTAPPATITLPPTTVVQYSTRQVTSTIVLPPVTSTVVQFAIRQVTTTATFETPGPTTTETETRTVTITQATTVTQTVGPTATLNPVVTYTYTTPTVTYDGGFKFPFPIPNFHGAGTYTIGIGSVITVNVDGSYGFTLGGPPSVSGGGSTTFAFPFTIPNFAGPGSYTLSPGNVVQVNADGSYYFTSGGPPTQGGGNTGGSTEDTMNFSFPFDIPGFIGPGTYTLSPGNVVQVNNDGSYTFVEGKAPTGNEGGATNTGGTFSFPFNIPGFTGPGTYTLSPGNVVSVSGDGSYSFLMGGPPSATNGGGGATNTGGTFSFPFNIPGFIGPGTYTLSPGNVVSVKGDGSYSFLLGGPPGGATVTSQPGFTFPTISLPSLNLGGGFSIGSYSGPGIYTLSPGNVVSVSSNGGFSFILGGSGNSAGSVSLPTVSLPTVTLPGGIVLPNFAGPGTYTVSPGNVLSVGIGGITWLQGGPQSVTATGNIAPTISLPGFTFPSITLPTLNLPTLNLGGGFSIGGFSGPGTYTVSPGNVVSVGANGAFSFLTGGSGNVAGSVSLPGVSLPTITLAGGITLPSYSGPGIYTYSPGNVLSIGVGGGITWLQGGPQTASGGGFTFPTISLPAFTFPSITLPTLNLPTLNLGGGFSIGGFSGPGTYTVSPGNVVSVGANGAFSFLTGGSGNVAGSVSLPGVSLPTITLAGGITLPSYSGPGIYTYSPGNVLSIGVGGGITWLQGGPQTASGGGFTFPTISLPAFTFPSITLPTLNLPTLNLGGGFSIGGFSGPGTYTVSPGNVVSVGANGAFSFLTGGSGNVAGSVSLPGVSLPTITLAGGITLPSYSGPGIYTYSPGNVLSIGVGGGITWLQGGPQTASGGGFTFPTISLPAFTFPSITLPTLNLPTLNLGGGFSIGGFSGPGTYTVSPGNVVSVGANGAFSFLTGGSGNVAGSVSLPGVSLPTITLAGGITLPSYSGPGIYTYSPGNVLSIGVGGGITWLQGGPQTASGGGFTFPTISLPAFTFPSITLPTLNLPTLNLGGGFSIGGFSGPGTYTVSPGNVVSVGANGAFSFLTGGSGNVAGSVSLPGVSLPTITLAGGITLPSYSGPGIYTYSPGNVLSIGVGGGITWLQGGPQTASGGGFTFPTISLPAFTFPSITLPTLNLPTLNLGGGFSIGGFSGPGTYTVSPGNVVSVGANGAFSFLTGGSGNVAGSVSLPGVSLPTITLAGGITLPSYSGPGIYTYSPGNVLSIGVGGGITWLQGGPQTASGGGFTFPTISLPAFTFPSITLPTLNLPTLNLGGGFSIGGFSGPGTYTVSPGNVVSVGANGAFSFLTGGSGNVAGSVSLPGVSLPTITLAGGITLPSYSGPGIYTYSPGNVLSIGVGGGITWLQGGPQTASGGGFTFPTISLPAFTFPSITLPTLNLPTLNLGGGFSIGGFSGPGTYTVSPGNVVSVGANGAFSFLTGGSGNVAGSVSLPGVSLPTITLAGGITLPSYSGPGIYTYSPGNVLSIGVGGGITWLQGGPQTASGGGFTFPTISLPAFTFPSITLPTLNLPTLNLGGGFSIGGFSGPGTYTVSPGNVVSVGANGAFSFLTGGSGNVAGSVSLPGVSLPTITLAGGITLPSYSGPGIYTYSPGNVLSIGVGGGITWLQGGPQTASGGGFTFPTISLPAFTFPSITLPTLNLPTLNLGGGFSIGGFSGPGTYTVSPGNVVSVGANGAFSFLTGGSGNVAGSVSLPGVSLPTITLAGGITLPSYSGPGIYTYSPGNVLSIGVGGGITWLQGGPQTASGGGFTFPTISLPAFTFPSITLPTLNLPTLNLGGGFSIGGFSGPGTYTVSPGNVVSVGANGAFSFLTGGSGNVAGSVSLPGVSLPTITLAGGITLPSYSGPGIYTYSPGNVLSIGVGGGITWLQGGPQTASGGGFTFPTISLPAFTFPSITLPTLNLPTLNLGGGFSIGGFSGPGTYTVSPGNVVSVGANGAFSFLTGGSGNVAGSVSLPGVSLPTITLAGGITLPSYSGPGIYTYSPGNVLSIGVGGGITWLQGGPQTASGGGFTFPTISLPAFTFPSITLPTLNLPTLNLGGGFSIGGFSGPGTYTVSPGNVVSVGANGAFSFLTGGSGNVAGSVSLPGVSLPTITLAGGITLPSYSGPGIYTYSPGNVLSIGVGGGITWLQGGPQTASGGGFTFPTISLPAFTFPSITLPTLNLPTLNLGGGFSIGGFSGPGTYTVSPGNVVSVGANGAFSFLTGGSGNVAGTVSLPGVSLPTLTLAGGITLPNYNGPGVYTYSPGNVVSIGLFGGVTWLQGGPSTAAGGGFTFPTLSLPAFTFPSISLPTLSLPSLNLGGGFTINGYNGPGTYTVSPGNVVSVNAKGAYTFISGGAGNTAGTVSLPGVSLPTLTLAGGITLPNYSGPGIYTYSPGNVVSIGLFGGVTWLQGGPSTAAGGGFTFPTFGFPSPTSTSAPAGITFPSITLPTLNLPVISLGNGLKISAYTGAGTYTVAPGVSLSVGANGVYTYLGNSGPSGSTGGSLTLPALALPTITLAGGIPVPNFSGPGLYTVFPGNVVSIGTSGGITWVQGGPQSLAGGGFTFPGFTFPTATTPAATGSPGSTVIGGVTFKFPFNIPGFYGPGIYILSIGNVVQVNNDGTYTFISGGPPVSSTSASPSVISSQPIVYPVTFPSISLPIVTFPTVNLPGGSAIPGFTGAGVYTVGSSVVSVDASGGYTYLSGNGFFNINSGNLNLPQFSFPTLTLAGGVQVPQYTGPGIYTISPGNQISIDASGGVRWILGGPQSIASQPTVAPLVTYATQISLPTITYPGLDLPTGGRIATYTGPGLYTLNANTVVSMDGSGSYSYTLGSGFFGIKTGSLKLPTLSFPPISLPGNFNVATFTGPGVYTVSPGNTVSINAAGILQWIQGGPNVPTVTAAPTSASATQLAGQGLTTTIGGVTFRFPFNIPGFYGPGIYILSVGNVVQVNADGTYTFISGSAPIITQSATKLMMAALPNPQASQSASSEGFVLPGFSFSAFSRRASPSDYQHSPSSSRSASSNLHQDAASESQSAGLFDHILALF
ncbi:hypothetical protein PS15p_207574 [Mucor circinelloides]